MVEPYVTIRETTEIKYDIVVDIELGRTREAMWWSADHLIERGCENTPSLHITTSRWHHHRGSSCIKKKRCSKVPVPQPNNDIYDHCYRLAIRATTIIDNGHGDQVDKNDGMTSTDIPSENLRTSNPKSGPKFHRNRDAPFSLKHYKARCTLLKRDRFFKVQEWSASRTRSE